jgi:hypothetical protein
VVPGGTYTVFQVVKNRGTVPTVTIDTTFAASGVPAGSTVIGVSDPARCTFAAASVSCHYGTVLPTATRTVGINLRAPTTLNANGFAALNHNAHVTAVFNNLGTDQVAANDNAVLLSQAYISDVGVALSGDQPGVTNGLDQGVHWTGQNVGTRTQPTISWVLDTGGVVDNDANNPLPAGCTVSGGVSQTVTCAQSNVPSGGTFSAYVLVKTPATGTSMTSSAHQVLGIAEFGGSSANDTASLVTSLNPVSPCGYECMQAVVKQGDTITWNSPSGDLDITFTIPDGADWTGGAARVTLRRISPTFTCGGHPCAPPVPEILAQPNDTESTPDPATAFQAEATYDVPGVCVFGGDRGTQCSPQHFLATGVYSGDAALNPRCPSYGMAVFNTGALNNCVQQVTALSANSERILSLFLRDISLPILSR